MNILGVDFGMKKIGLAVAMGSPLAEPLKTVKYKSDEQFLRLLDVLIDEHNIELIVIGMPNGKISKKINQLIELLKISRDIDVVSYPEDYSSIQAQFQGRQAGRNKDKIKSKEHQWAATIILQNYIDNV